MEVDSTLIQASVSMSDNTLIGITSETSLIYMLGNNLSAEQNLFGLIGRDSLPTSVFMIETGETNLLSISVSNNTFDYISCEQGCVYTYLASASSQDVNFILEDNKYRSINGTHDSIMVAISEATVAMTTMTLKNESVNGTTGGAYSVDGGT